MLSMLDPQLESPSLVLICKLSSLHYLVVEKIQWTTLINISKNQDDCLAINSGTDITFTKGTCSGGHGLSIGSVGGRDDNTVKTVTISSSTITKSDNGVRIKTVYGATGSVSGVTYKDITLSSIAKYGIVM
jgi:polygalacturonase